LALVLHIRNLAGEYPEKWEVNALYVDFFRALTRLAESQSRRYVALMGDPPDPTFCDRALALAKSAERARMKRLHEAFQGTKTADLAAIYLAKRCSDGGPEDLREAKDLIDRHRAAWLADGALWQRAKSALGSLLPHPPDYLKSLDFTDTTGKRWTVEDLRNKKTVFAFFFPPRREYIERFNTQVGSREQIIAVPMTTGPLQPGNTVTVDSHYTDVSALAKLLGVRVIPGMAVVTPQLDVISGVEEVGNYLRAKKVSGTFF